MMDVTDHGRAPGLYKLCRRMGVKGRQTIPVLIGLVTALAFLPVLGNDFVLWDDDRLLLDNPAFRGLGLTRLRWMFTAFFMGHYMPLTWVTYGLDYVLWGMNPIGYHLTNLLLHVGNAVVFYFVARRLLGGNLLGSLVAALLFAVHPLRVESVAWVTERRDVLSGLGYLLAVTAYLRAIEQPEIRGRWMWYWMSVGVFAMSLLAKGIAVTLPVVLLILDVYPLRRLGWGRELKPSAGVVIEKIPYLILSAAASVTALFAQSHVLTSLSDLGWSSRVAVASHGIIFYLWKTVLPLDLLPLYEPQGPVTPIAWPFLPSMLAVLAVSVVAIALRRRWPALLAVWSVYVVTLLPVSGLFQAGPQMIADRYSYLATLGWAILVGAGVQWWWANATFRHGRLQLVVGLALMVLSIAMLATLTWKQTLAWRNTVALWQHMLAVNPSASAHNNLGVFWLRAGQLRRATEHFRQALRLNPGSANARANLGEVLSREGRWAEAMEEYRQALELTPEITKIRVRLGTVLLRLERWSEAVEHFKLVLRDQPEDREALHGLAAALSHVKRTHP